MDLKESDLTFLEGRAVMEVIGFGGYLRTIACVNRFSFKVRKFRCKQG
jgi:hypothetical protein